tara:strand:- start:574 stop:1239 length:666 start_codon:yes stop_codon:yes gene_type:complete
MGMLEPVFFLFTKNVVGCSASISGVLWLPITISYICSALPAGYLSDVRGGRVRWMLIFGGLIGIGASMILCGVLFVGMGQGRFEERTILIEYEPRLPSPSNLEYLLVGHLPTWSGSGLELHTRGTSVKDDAESIGDMCSILSTPPLNSELASTSTPSYVNIILFLTMESMLVLVGVGLAAVDIPVQPSLARIAEWRELPGYSSVYAIGDIAASSGLQYFCN